MRVLPLFILAALSVLAKHGEEDHNDKSSSLPSAATTTPLSATPTSSAPPEVSTAPFQFLPPSNATTCLNTTMKWTYTATANLLMTITITNERAAGVQSSAPQNGSTLVSRTLTDSVSSLAQQIPWDPVDVQEGPYVAVAFDTNRTAGIFVTSSQFFVLNGQDTSCLMSNGTSSPSEIASTTGATTSPSQSTVPDDSPSETQPKTLSSGALAGTIVGVIVGVVLLLVAFSFPHIWRHSLPSTSRSRRAGGPYLLF